MAELAGVSNPYLSQVERGLHEPSVRILRSIADALNLSAETVLEQAGLLSPDDGEATSTEDAIRHDPELNEDQKLALLSVYRSYRSSAADAGLGEEGSAGRRRTAPRKRSASGPQPNT